MNDNRCPRSGTRVWAYGPPSGVDTEVITCPGCGQRVHMSIATSRVQEHDAAGEGDARPGRTPKPQPEDLPLAAQMQLRALDRSPCEPYTGST